jgi:DNA-binding transcriptional ArsR family regulator
MQEAAYIESNQGGAVTKRWESAAQLLRTLGSPVRLAILAQLNDRELCVHDIVDELDEAGGGVSQPLVSQHLRVLRQRGLVRTRRRGREVVYTLADSHISHIIADASDHVHHPVDNPAPDKHPHRPPAT